MPESNPPTDINEYRRLRELPDPEFLYTDDEGTPWYCYDIVYTDAEGKEFSFPLWATSFDDAEARLKAIAANGRVEGQLYHREDF